MTCVDVAKIAGAVLIVAAYATPFVLMFTGVLERLEAKYDYHGPDAEPREVEVRT